MGDPRHHRPRRVRPALALSRPGPKRDRAGRSGAAPRVSAFCGRRVLLFGHGEQTELVYCIAWGVPAGSGRINQRWGEPLHPAINRDVVDGNASLGQQLFDVSVGQPIAQIPPHCQRDHVRRKPEPRDAGRWR